MYRLNLLALKAVESRAIASKMIVLGTIILGTQFVYADQKCDAESNPIYIGDSVCSTKILQGNECGTVTALGKAILLMETPQGEEKSFAYTQVKNVTQYYLTSFDGAQAFENSGKTYMSVRFYLSKTESSYNPNSDLPVYAYFDLDHAEEFSRFYKALLTLNSKPKAVQISYPITIRGLSPHPYPNWAPTKVVKSLTVNGVTFTMNPWQK